MSKLQPVSPKESAPAKGKLRTVAELIQEYPNEWILLEITRDHRDYRRVVGRLLAHSANRDDLDQPYDRFRAEHPHARTFELFTGAIVPEGITVIL